MAEHEIEATIETANEHLKDAEDALREGRYHGCAYYSAAAAENAGNALIIALASRSGFPARAFVHNKLIVHRNAEAIESVTKCLKPKWLRKDEFKKMLESLGSVEPHIIKSRYPIKVKEGTFVPPSEYYTEKTAKDTLEKAVFTVNTIKLLLKLLVRSGPEL